MGEEEIFVGFKTKKFLPQNSITKRGKILLRNPKSISSQVLGGKKKNIVKETLPDSVLIFFLPHFFAYVFPRREGLGNIEVVSKRRIEFLSSETKKPNPAKHSGNTMA